jgi:uncharacterized protein RhaS with RHS repeats
MGYNPENGRFINEDPIGLSGGLNMYGFVSNDPMNFLDPFGLKSLSKEKKVIKAMCCIWYRTNMDPADKIERSFMVTQHNVRDKFYIVQYGQKGTRYKNKSNFSRYSGFHFEAYYHTHPPGEPNNPSKSDQQISRDLDIPVYTIGGKTVSKWYHKDPRNKFIMSTPALSALCMANIDEWKDCCPE